MTTRGRWHGLVWVALAGLVGFVVPALFSTVLRWDRSLFVVAYVLIAGSFLRAYARRAPVTPWRLVDRWPQGVLGAAVASALLLWNVLEQPASTVPQGRELVVAVAWIGVVYGAMDSLLLSVMPVLAVQGPAPLAAIPAWRPRLARGLLALSASVFVTAAYHLGYAEFRGSKLLSAIIGNVVITASYLLTGSPLAALLAHVVMHVAAVLHGMETTLQVPPHYGP